MDFNFLYGLFDVFISLGSKLFNWLCGSVYITESLQIPVYTIVLASGLTIGLGARLIRSFLGN